MRIHKTRLLHLNSLKSPHRLRDKRRSSQRARPGPPRTGDTRSPWLPEHVISKVAQKCILILTIKESRGKLYIPWNVTYILEGSFYLLLVSQSEARTGLRFGKLPREHIIYIYEYNKRKLKKTEEPESDGTFGILQFTWDYHRFLRNIKC